MPKRSQAFATSDWGYRSLSILVWLVTFWLLAMPVSRFVQDAMLRRYHLQAESFVSWAIQAPIPAMYNFHNRYSLGPRDWDRHPVGPPVTGTLNHFPVRLYTFGDSRPTMVDENDRHTLTVTSSYRNHSLTTRWVIVRTPDNTMELIGEVVR